MLGNWKHIFLKFKSHICWWEAGRLRETMDAAHVWLATAKKHILSAEYTLETPAGVLVSQDSGNPHHH